MRLDKLYQMQIIILRGVFLQVLKDGWGGGSLKGQIPHIKDWLPVVIVFQ